MIQIILSGVVSIVGGVLIFLIQGLIRENRKLRLEKNKEENAKNIAIIVGLQCLLRSKLIELYYKYVNEDMITRTDYENWDMMYKAYKDLGGNGVVSHMEEEIEHMKIKKHI